MPVLYVGDEVRVGCAICGAAIDPWKHCCSRECHRELDWRKALVSTGTQYKLDPESRLGKLAAQMDAEAVRLWADMREREGMDAAKLAEARMCAEWMERYARILGKGDRVEALARLTQAEKKARPEAQKDD